MNVGIANPRWRENVLSIPSACATRNFTYLARSPCRCVRSASKHKPGTKDICQIMKLIFGIHGIVYQNPLNNWAFFLNVTYFLMLFPINIFVKTDICSNSLFVCLITKSFLTDSFVLPTPTLSTICMPLSSYTCSITPATVNVGSSYSHMRGPGVGCWLSDHSNCSHWSFEAAALPINPNIYTDQWEPIVIYHYITLTGRYTTMQPTLLTSWLQLLSYKR